MIEFIDKTGTISKADLFKQMYGDRDLSTPIEHSLVECNFNQQLDKLCKEQRIDIWGGNVYIHSSNRLNTTDENFYGQNE